MTKENKSPIIKKQNYTYLPKISKTFPQHISMLSCDVKLFQNETENIQWMELKLGVKTVIR